MAMVTPDGFKERLAGLRSLRAGLDGQIAEVEFWLEMCARADAMPEPEAQPGPKKAPRTAR